MIPSIVIKQLKNGLVEYLDTTFPISNELFSGTIYNFITEKDKVFKEPYLSVKLPFKTSEKSLDSFGFDGLELKYKPYLHQETAFTRLLGQEPKSTLVATGTGSGKTECFTYPILEYCYRKRGETGIKAIIIYPMNALATDQAKRLAELVFKNDKLKKSIKIGMYVGDKGATENMSMTDVAVINHRDTLRKDPPDILLTNYKMLDYLLTRPTDFELWTKNNSETLKFLAVDEFHTFDGAQGTDLACLIRRLKKHLGTPENYLTCVGTSATMGSDNNKKDMFKFASDVFGETFSQDSIITESRETALDFLEKNNPKIFDIPSRDDLQTLENSVLNDNYLDFMIKNYKVWLKKDVDRETIENIEFRINLSSELFDHYFFHELILATNNQTINYEKLIDELTQRNAQLKYYDFAQKKIILESLMALVSHARAQKDSIISQFLNVHIQIWFKELRRVLATVTPNPKFDLADDINDLALKEYLPVVNCRECGATGWAGKITENNIIEVTDLRDFYTSFFEGNKNVKLIFPDKVTDKNSLDQGYVCPKCHNLIFAVNMEGACSCSKCGNEELIEVFIDHQNEEKETDRKNYTCPYCNSKHGLVLVGAQGSTMISAGVSELFASKYNDDKKLLTFSDSVQDASHRAGFFNARTWKFNLRVAIQQYAETLDTTPNIKEFSEGLINYLRATFDKESFISTFIPMNLITDLEFEYLQANNKLSTNTNNIERLINQIENRIILETYYEYGFKSRIGRTLEKANASVLDFNLELVDKAVEDLELVLKNEVGALTHITKTDIYNFVQGVLLRLKKSGAIELKFLNSMIENDSTFMLY
nr:DEAD/DEAH box helicase [Fusobacteriaceae bacterium]